jgi:hypothetical protein
MLVQQATRVLALSINKLFHPLVEFVHRGLAFRLTPNERHLQLQKEL